MTTEEEQKSRVEGEDQVGNTFEVTQKSLRELRDEREQKSLQSLRSDVQAETGETKEGETKSPDEKVEVKSTYELIKGSKKGSESETYKNLINVISSNPKDFKNLPGNTVEEKLENIFKSIHDNVVEFLESKLGKSHDEVIKNTIAPAIERNLMELLRQQGNQTNIKMLKELNGISFDTIRTLYYGVRGFADSMKDSFGNFYMWMNAIDYLSVHSEEVLVHPEKSEVLTDPIEFRDYMNNSNFAKSDFSPYAQIDDNIFKIHDDKNFKFGITKEKMKDILEQLGHIQVANTPDTTVLITKLISKSGSFFKASSGFKDMATQLLNGASMVNPILAMFGKDIFLEIDKFKNNGGIPYLAVNFILKLIGISGGVEGILQDWRYRRLDFTDEKKGNIKEIFEKYHNLMGSRTSVSISDANSFYSALSSFSLTDLNRTSTTEGDYLRDAVVDNINLSLITPNIVQQTIGTAYLKKEIITVDGRQEERMVVDPTKITYEKKRELVHLHMFNMKTYLEENYNNLGDFYSNIHNNDDLSLCIIASFYVDKNDVIEGVKAKVFLPENYRSADSDGSAVDSSTSSGSAASSDGTPEEDSTGSGGESQQQSGEVSQYKLSPGARPFKDVPPYLNISAYDLRDAEMTPSLDYSELTKKHEGVATLDGSNIKNQGSEYPSNGTIGNKSNNPCDISHSPGDVGYKRSTKLRDGQDLAIYDTPVNGIASAMRLLKRKYSNKSITEIDVGGYQGGPYRVDEEIGLSALRLKWITDQCNALGVGPHEMLDFNDPMTLKSFVAQIAVVETGTHIGKKLLDEAYDIAFS